MNHSTSWPFKAFRLPAAAWVVLATLSAGCENDPQLPGVYASSTSVTLPTGASGCEEGQERICGVTLDLTNDVVTCYRGTQICSEGKWSECGNGEVTREPFTAGDKEGLSRRHPSALSTPVACDDPTDPFFNACDPGCMYFLEDRADIDGGGVNPGVPLTTPTYAGQCSTNVCSAIDEPLEAGCSPCITSVCAAYPSCCGASGGVWDSDCVAAAGKLCSGVTIEPGLCDYGLFADQKITTAGRPAANASIAAYGDIEVGTDANVTGGIFSKGNITFKSLNKAPVNVPGGIWADGNISSEDSDSDVNADIYSGGAVSPLGWNLSAGSEVKAMGNIKGNSGTKLVGGASSRASITDFDASTVGPLCQNSTSCYTHVPIALPPKTAGTAIPTYTTICTNPTTTSSGTNITVTPGTHGHIDAINGADLILNGEGTYYFNSLKLGSGDLVLQADQGGKVGWDVRVCGEVTLRNDTKVKGAGAGLNNDPNGVLLDNSLLVLYSGSTADLSWQTNVYFSGVFLLPKAKLSKSNVNNPPTVDQILAKSYAAPINGAIWAKELYLDTGAQTFQINKTACERIVPDAAGSCEAPGTDSGTQAALNEPCISGRDCQMNFRCDQPRTENSCGHSKCKTGAALIASCDECVARICDKDASCCSGSWTAACVGMVATVCDATCGADSGAGKCVRNLVGDKQSTCNGYDLALDIPCDNRVTICNHGTGAFSGNLKIGYWSEDDNQMSFEYPVVPWDDRCSLTGLSIPSGGCVDATCPQTFSEVQTLMLDPNNELPTSSPPGECNAGRLDNWTVRDGQTCPLPPLAPVVSLQEAYSATCPDDTVALWSLFGWKTEVTGAPSITFEAVTAESAADLATAMASPSNFTPIGVAAYSATPANDTQNCGVLNPCVVDLAAALGLGKANHPQHLGLRMVLDSGTPVPTLEDWFVTYSCRFDQ